MSEPVQFDPACGEAHAMERRHGAERRALLGETPAGSRLAMVVLEKQEREAEFHMDTCAKCCVYVPPCAGCGALDARSHTFRCAHNPSPWRSLFARKRRAAIPPRQKAAPPRAPRVQERLPEAPLTPLHDKRPIAAPKPRLDKNGKPPRAPPKAAPKPPERPAARSAQPPPTTAPRRPTVNAPTAPRGKARPSPRTPQMVLNVAPDASWDVIRTAYRKLAAQYHPDKVAHLAPEFREMSERRMRELNDAYAMLRQQREALAGTS